MDKKRFVRDCIFHLALVIMIVLVDQLTKAWARECLSERPVILWKNVFSLQLVFNTGGPWGLLGKYTILLTVFSVLIFCFLVGIYLRMPRTKRMVPLRICAVLIVAGAVGNFIDRIIFHKVTDLFSFDLIHFPVFNVADIAITCGCILAFALTLFYYKDEDFQWKK